MIKLSVIVPNYNKEKYVGKLLQQLKERMTEETEVIVIDDCSTDNSSSIINEYKDVFKIIQHTENQYVCVSRNDGIKAAKGKYVTFIDSDDEIEDNFFDAILEHITSNKDAYFFDYNIIHHDGTYRYDVTKGYNAMVWTKVYKKKFLKDNNIRFREEIYTPGVLSEDFDFNMQLLSKTQNVDVIDCKIIKYRWGLDHSISNSEQTGEGSTEFDHLYSLEFAKKWFT